MRALNLLAAIALAGCASMPRTETVQAPITVKVPVIVPVPAELVRDHQVYQRTSGTVGEYRRQAVFNTIELEACRQDKAEMRALPTDGG